MTPKPKNKPKIHPLDPMVKAWERQPKEPEQGFAAFVLYRDAGDERSLRKVATQLDKWVSQIDGWCLRWSWRRRILDYDRHLDAIKVKARADEVGKATARHAKMSASALVVLQQPINVFLRKMQSGALKEELEGMNGMQILNMLTRAAGAIKDLVEVERVALGVPARIDGTIGTNLDTISPKTFAAAVEEIFRVSDENAEPKT